MQPLNPQDIHYSQTEIEAFFSNTPFSIFETVDYIKKHPDIFDKFQQLCPINIQKVSDKLVAVDNRYFKKKFFVILIISVNENDDKSEEPNRKRKYDGNNNNDYDGNNKSLKTSDLQ